MPHTHTRQTFAYTVLPESKVLACLCACSQLLGWRCKALSRCTCTTSGPRQAPQRCSARSSKSSHAWQNYASNLSCNREAQQACVCVHVSTYKVQVVYTYIYIYIYIYGHPPPKIYLERSCIKYSSLQGHYILIWKCTNTVNYGASVNIT